MDVYATERRMARAAHQAELRAEAGEYTFGDSVLRRQVHEHLDRMGWERTPVNVHLAVVAVLGEGR